MKNLFKALADFQQEVPIIHKGTSGYGYSYADLPDTIEIINPYLAKNKLKQFSSINNASSLASVLLKTLDFATSISQLSW